MPLCLITAHKDNISVHVVIQSMHSMHGNKRPTTTPSVRLDMWQHSKGPRLPS